MKIRSQVYILQLIILSIFILTIVASYYFYNNEYKNNIKKQIDGEIAVQKSYLAYSLRETRQHFDQKRELFEQVHLDALATYRKNPNVSLKTLQTYLTNKYKLGHTDVDVFLVNRDFKVTHATLAKDVGFDLAQFPSVVSLLNKTLSNNKVNFASAISQDPLDLKYKLYSYAKISDGLILELAFSEASFNSGIHTILKKATPDINITIFNVLQDKKANHYFYYAITPAQSSGELIENKQALLDKKVIFSEKNKINNPIANTFFSKNNISVLEDGKQVVYANILDENMVKTEYQNIIVRFEISSLQTAKFQAQIKRNFLSLILFSSFFLLILNWVIRKQLLTPMNIVIEKIQAREQIPLEKLHEHSEFYAISKEYNKSFLKLTNEVRRTKKMTEIDHLTQVGNRKAFETDITHLLETHKKEGTVFCILLFDVDNFKKINDKFGHLKGDEVLIDLCKQTVLAIRKNDYFYRTGGEEFVLLLDNTPLAEAKVVAQKIRENIEEHFQYIRAESVTVSGGLSEVMTNDTVVSIYKRVDALQYEAKQQGKNQIQVRDGSVV